MDEIRVSAAKQRLELRLVSLLQVCTRLAFSLSFGLREKTGHQVTTFTTWIARFVYGICWHVYCPVCPDPDPEQSAPTCSAHYGGVREAPLLLGFGRDALRSSWREKVEKEMTTTDMPSTSNVFALLLLLLWFDSIRPFLIKKTQEG